MKKTLSPAPMSTITWASVGQFLFNLLLVAAPFFLIELYGSLILSPSYNIVFAFAAIWAVFIGCCILLLPRKIGRIAFGVIYFALATWTMAQCGYYLVFGKMMFVSTVFFAGEGAGYLGDILADFPAVFWISIVALVVTGVLLIWFFPKKQPKLLVRLPYLLIAIFMFLGIYLLPRVVFQKDKDVWGTRSDYGQSSSLRAAYNVMYDAKKVYDFCGVNQLLMRDVWRNQLYPLTPAYRSAQKEDIAEIDAYFAQRQDSGDNDMTGILKGKNVILVLMESMDDWMITETDTPTLSKLMDEGINFTDMYTPGYGATRTLNSEFCMNTGIYMPTTGRYLFNYVTNDFNQSIASQLTANGYSAEVFHYNDPSFYSRGVIEPALGYNSYVYYGDYTSDEDALYDDCLLFDIPEVSDIFFREGQTFNTIITRSAHLSYKYNEVLSHYALKQYPEYRGMYGSEEEDCARLKAKLVDDMFARLLTELEANEQLDNTVIIGMTDHYTYGYKNMDELYAHSGVDDDLLLEKTPFFVWSTDCPDLEVTKTVNTSDVVPTLLNLLGVQSPYNYLGQDAFDPNYEGYALFPDGSWISGGVACKAQAGGGYKILENNGETALSAEFLAEMSDKVQTYIRISNLLLTTDYYKS